MRAFSWMRRPKPRGPAGRRVYAIGDIHGRADLLASLLARLDADKADSEAPPYIVFIGDYVDRGLQSRDVIDLALGVAARGYEPIFLKGNHEAALLSFLDEPDSGAFWFSLGGAETLFSYGVPAPRPGASEAELRFASRALRAAIPHEHLRFLARLRLHARLGDYLFVHAGLRPGEPLERQSESDLLEIRGPFLRARLHYPFTIVHGHSPVDSVDQRRGRIAIDTGAYATGRLSALRLEGAEIGVLST